jgi:excisionase family DNA binding protein
MKDTTETLPAATPRFYDVHQVATLFGTSPMTIYRAINSGEFPAIRIRGGIVIPARAIDNMENAAIEQQWTVSASEFTLNDTNHT